MTGFFKTGCVAALFLMIAGACIGAPSFAQEEKATERVIFVGTENTINPEVESYSSVKVYSCGMEGADPKELFSYSLCTSRDTLYTVGPRLSPDGKMFVYVDGTITEDRRISSDIWVAGADGKDPKKLTASGRLNTSPAWSKDGADIFYISYEMDRSKADLKCIAPDGTRERTIQRISTGVSMAICLTPSAKKMFILGIGSILWSANPNGTGLKELPTSDMFGINLTDVRLIALSPDGSKLVLTTQETGAGYKPFVLNTADQVVSTVEAAENCPCWLATFSPNGRQLGGYAADTSSGSAKEIVVMPVEGFGTKRLPVGDRKIGSALCWSPDGTKLLFSATDTNGGETFYIWILEVSAKKLRRVTGNEFNEICPIWVK
jgi:hypothetical protein